ncbi:MAG TPA: hypothetical protein VFN49_08340 [Candidatus Aquilonibacter sp.]|nr:hypothetical protein [Candidatus Aquilonibacter sp.]
MTSAPSLTDLLARVPQLNEHTVAPPALAPLPEMRELEASLRAIVAASPQDARAIAALGNVMARRALYIDAREAYLRATAIDETFAQAHLAVAELSSLLRDEITAQQYLSRALSLSRRYDDPLPIDGRHELLLVLRDATYAQNAPVEVLVDRRRIAIHKLYVGDRPREAVPAYDAVLCAFGPYAGDERVAALVTDVLGDVVPLNRPASIRNCARERLAPRLAGLDTLDCVESRRIARAALADIALPALVRPQYSHAGFGLALIESHEQLAAHAARFPAEAYDVSRWVEYRSPDGYYRKYRAVIVGGRAYPYHLAISPRWMVHYLSSPMRVNDWMREEEARFLHAPHLAVPAWERVMTELARALDLDYVGVDFTVRENGNVLVFEADPAMLIHDEDEDDVFAYKRPHVAAIRRALEQLAGLR